MLNVAAAAANEHPGAEQAWSREKRKRGNFGKGPADGRGSVSASRTSEEADASHQRKDLLCHLTGGKSFPKSTPVRQQGLQYLWPINPLGLSHPMRFDPDVVLVRTDRTMPARPRKNPPYPFQWNTQRRPPASHPGVRVIPSRGVDGSLTRGRSLERLQ